MALPRQFFPVGFLTVLGAFAAALPGPAAAAPQAAAAASRTPSGAGSPARQPLPTGQWLTPTAAPGAVLTSLNPHLASAPEYLAGQPVSEALSPDGRTLLVLTSGYNRRTDAHGQLIKADSDEYVFVFDVSEGKPAELQVLHVPNTYVGIAFAPDGEHFVAAGGGDDCLHVFARTRGRWAAAPGSPIQLGHGRGLGIEQLPMAQGVAVTAAGRRALVTNRYNASLTVVDLTGGKVEREIELRPGKVDADRRGQPGGNYPNAVRALGEHTAFVASERDREIDVVDLDKGAVRARIPLPGNPTRLLLNAPGTRLYVALENADAVAVIDTGTLALLESMATLAPQGLAHLRKAYRGASPNGLALSEDERTLYVTNRGTNSVAVIDLAKAGRVTGLIPTGWYPSDVVLGPRGTLHVVNTYSLPGPNPGNCLGYQKVPCPVSHSPVRFAPGEYILNLTKGGLLSLPLPDTAALARLTRQVAANNHFARIERAARLMARLRERIHHVIYIVKENRTYDQVLGDLHEGNGAAELAEFPESTTPNQHALARRFVLFDDFYDSGDVSGNGWPWSVAARESDAGAKMLPVNYADRGGSYDWEGTNSNINVALTGAARRAANPLRTEAVDVDELDVLPGSADVAAPDGPDGERQQGYLWSAALRRGLTVRNYGFMLDLTRYSLKLRDGPQRAAYIALETDPHSQGLAVAYAATPELVDRTDAFFRGFDPAFPDTYREAEWEREFREFCANGRLPTLSLVRLPGDHTGHYAHAIAGVNTPERQVADNDYAVGRLVERVASSRYARDTLIFIVEDDAQDGPDHVDAHRSIAFIIGPYVRHGAIDHHRYSTVSLLRTMTDVLGLDHLSLFDATEGPMSSAFDLAVPRWSYRAVVSGLLRAPGVSLPIPPDTAVSGASGQQPTYDASWWEARTAQMNFDREDALDSERYNRILWEGLMSGRPYPADDR